jgi:hypothetical protein
MKERVPDNSTWKFDQRISQRLQIGWGCQNLRPPDVIYEYDTKPSFDDYCLLIHRRPWRPNKSVYKNWGKSVTLKKHSLVIKDNYTKDIDDPHLYS